MNTFVGLKDDRSGIEKTRLPRAKTFPKAKTEADYLALANRLGIIWHGRMVQNSTTKTDWTCASGHPFQSSYANLADGRHCRLCGNQSKAEKMKCKAPDYIALADQAGVKWLDKEAPANARAKTRWACTAGHAWNGSYDHLRKSRKCPICSKKAGADSLRLKAGDYENLAAEKNMQWLGPPVNGALKKTNWRCHRGHVFSSSYNWVEQTGCKDCVAVQNSRDGAVTEVKLQQLAQAHGLEWLGPLVPTTSAITNWRCPCGNEWETTASSIKFSWGCPKCGTLRRKKKRAKLADQDYLDMATERGFEWLGPPVTNNSIKTEWRCAKGHPWFASYGKLSQGRGCPDCAVTASSFNRQKKESAYTDAAQRFNLTWLGTSLPRNSKTHTAWRCREGHDWDATLGHIQAGKGCPTCGTKRAADLQRHKKSAYAELAQLRGIIWIGPEQPKNRQDKTLWECPKGHPWEASFSTISAKRGCPVCGKASAVDNLRLKPVKYHALAQARGWKWLGPEVLNSATKTKWECGKGHRFESAYAWIQSGNGCGNCADMVKGVRVSQVQRELALMLDGDLNERVGNYAVDVALERDGYRIAVEYDSWYYHAERLAADEQRSKYLISQGWKVLQIRSNYLLPEEKLVMANIDELTSRNLDRATITLRDWGVGNIFSAKPRRKLARVMDGPLC